MVVKDRSRVDDYWTGLAIKEGYPARSVYKLKEMDESRRLIKAGARILDLGCSPGSWSLYACRRGARAAGVDLEPPRANMPAGFRFFLWDVYQSPPPELRELSPFPLVLSDLAPKTTGRKDQDSDRSLDLAGAALSWAESLLASGGNFLFKVFQGGGLESFVREKVGPLFRKTEYHRPKAVRKRSPELYVLCLGFR
ncbi:MAG: RlmE family RNA methyltransferase, partial [Deltaproteobacteria bacterium]|nr:RlmE family RNA methyltransferase [Deltaproteobacteria bacterium]